MRRSVWFGLCLVIAVSNALRVDDWVIKPTTSPEGVTCTTSPFWDYRKNYLYFLAPKDNKIYTLEPSTKELKSVAIDSDVVFIQPTEDPDCIVYGVGNEIKTINWNGKEDKMVTKSLAKIEDAGDDPIIMAGSVSFYGNLSFIVKAQKNNTDNYFIYTMQLDQKPFKLSSPGLEQNKLDSIFWICKDTYLYVASSTASLTFQCKYHQQAGLVSFRVVQTWFVNQYIPVGESKEDMEGWWYQLMQYANHADSDITRVNNQFYQVNYTVSSVKKLTSEAWGGEDLTVLYITSEKSEYDTISAAGGLFECSTIGATGRPAFIATSSLNTGINYCETPKPSLVTPPKPTSAPPVPTPGGKCNSKCLQCKKKKEAAKAKKGGGSNKIKFSLSFNLGGKK